MLTGNTGRDVFIFDVLTTTALRDTIKDFALGEDKIVLSRSAFSGLASMGALSGTEFVTGTKATTANHHVIYNAATGALYYDNDGVGGAAMVHIATLSNHAFINAGDIMVI